MGAGLILRLIFALIITIPALAQYPDQQVTPGVVRTTDGAEICNPQFRTKPFRHTTEKMKREAFRLYGLCNGGLDKPCRKKYEVDHLLPLELGGNDVQDNLWPQAYTPTPGAHQKDIVENFLKKQVCAGTIELIEAQHDIRTDWLSVYNSMSPDQKKVATWHR